MKNYKEMARCVLEARDEHDRQVRRRRQVLRRCAPAAAAFCFAVLLGFGVWRQKQTLPRIPPQEPTETTIETATHETAETAQTPQTHPASTSSAQSESSAGSAQTSKPETDSPAPTEDTQPTVNLPPAVPEPVTEPTELPEPPPETAAEPSSEPEPITEPTKSGLDEDPNIFEAKPWDDMTINEQYFMAEFGEPLRFYQTAKETADAGEVGDYLCEAYMSGYDWFGDVYYHCTARAYALRGHPEQEVIAVQFDGDAAYYLYTLEGRAEDAEEG